MELKKIGFKNYKAFKNLQEIDIKPVTILIGKNSSGKSIVSRLPLLLAKSLNSNSNSPIELQFDNFEFGGAFRDLVYNKIEHGSIAFKLLFEINDNTIEIEATIQNIADSPLQFISNYKLRNNEFEIELTHILDSKTNFFSEKQRYNSKGTYECAFDISFKGLLINVIECEEIPAEILYKSIDPINTLIRNCMSKIDYIGPFRAQPLRDYIFKGSKPSQTGYSGELAPHILGIDGYFDNNIKSSVGNWFKEKLGGWQLDVNKIGNKFAIVLISPDDPSVKVNLKDVGHGMSQVLPLIVRSFLNTENSMNSIMIIEQPELHLHPSAHGDLAELFVNIIQKEKSKWIIETHSDVFILRIRRLIASGIIDSNDVVLYYIDDESRPGSSLKKITIDSEGEVDYWPEKIFRESFDEVTALRTAQNK